MVTNSEISRGRVLFLDGLRGTAIAMVLFYHGFHRWREIEPWEQPISVDNTAALGGIGVQLLFVISGFVIFLTLERTTGPWTFLARRWLRLFPAMLMASFLLFALSFLLVFRPEGPLSAMDLLPGLLFVAPWNIATLSGLDLQSVDGAFWFTYVEAIFYVIVFLSFYLLRDSGGYLVQALFLLWLVAELGGRAEYGIGVLSSALARLGAGYFGWFAVGICAFKHFETGDRRYVLAILSFALAASIGFSLKTGVVTDTFLALAAAAAFLLPLHFHAFRRFFANPAILFLGYLSYPLYLIHENTVTGAAKGLFEIGLVLPSWAMPILPIGGVVVMAYIIARLEPILKRCLRNWFAALFSLHSGIGRGT